ncbi:MAG: serine threonine kinase [Lasallia pustulata]|uniref:Serine threonine kinase n=1 Tax=Lasallia pustulata TaxID=136370 RepID=A0A5M8PCN0_9LECA|nr:MAG: serine threonine kinase [Lasallia pustulata]
MEDLNLIMMLKATRDLSKYAFCQPHNSDRYFPPSHEVDNESTNLSSREATPYMLPETEADKEDSSHRIQLTFTQRPKNIREGYVFGSDPRVYDILLGNRGCNRLSNWHFCITFDEQKRVVLRDFSRWGTSVSYDGQARNQIRHHFTWIINFNDEKVDFKTIEVRIAGRDPLTFEIKLAEHKTCKDEYGLRLNSYLEESRTALPLFNMLRIYSQETTAAPTQPLSPGQHPIYVKSEEVGQGEFGRVYRVKDVSTGLSFAGKTFLSDCQREVEIMRGVSHLSMFIYTVVQQCLTGEKEHIVQFMNFTEEPVPMLVMEYLPLGSMIDLHQESPITVEETITILHQGLRALEYLHFEGIAH